MRKDFEKIPDCQALEWISQEDIAHLIQETDIAITRWSATTLAELTAFEKKLRLIIIPLPYAAYNHQYYNALEYEKMGHTLLEQKNISQLTKLL
jgi:UDP-N-acetylglucosamine--N-acetylmuramyl-(pentapeptide) pyrophosphoryl-undecaprenol N-acetylglucosamine transferase